MPNRLTFLGHATVLLELAGQRLLTDPALRDRFLLGRRQIPLPAAEHTERIDTVLISHAHPDHLDFKSLRSLDGAPRLVVPRRGRSMLRRHRLQNAVELDPGLSVRVGGVEITATEAEHDGRRFKFGRHMDALGYLIEAAGTRVYFAGDTDLFDGMEELRGRVDVAVLPIGGWGPDVGEGHLDPERAARAAAIIEPQLVVPIHWGAYLRRDLQHRRDELLNVHPSQFENELARHATNVQARVLAPGESLNLI